MANQLSRRNDPSERVAPVAEFFAHVADARRFLGSLAASGRLQEVMQLGQAHFARGIERRLAELPRSRSLPAGQRAALSHAHAGAMLSLLEWWLDHGTRERPADLDALFHRIV